MKRGAQQEKSKDVEREEWARQRPTEARRQAAHRDVDAEFKLLLNNKKLSARL